KAVRVCESKGGRARLGRLMERPAGNGVHHAMVSASIRGHKFRPPAQKNCAARGTVAIMAIMVDELNPTTPPPSPPQSKGGPKMIDVQGMIRQASRRVSVDQLVKSGRKTISMLSRERIDDLINQAVKTMIDKYRDMAAGISNV